MSRNVTTMTISLTPELFHWLTLRAKEENISRSKLVSMLVDTAKRKYEYTHN